MIKTSGKEGVGSIFAMLYRYLTVCVVSQVCPHLCLSGLGLPLVHGPAGVHSGPGVAADAPGQNRVPAPMLLLLGSLVSLVSLCHLTESKRQVDIC